jgi:hypothetical protein
MGMSKKLETSAYGQAKEELERTLADIREKNLYDPRKMNRNRLGFVNSYEYNALISDINEKYDTTSSLGARLLAGRLILNK